MPDGSAASSRVGTRYAVPHIDDLGLVAARHVDRLHGAAETAGLTRWADYLAPLPDRLRDGDLRELRSAAMRVRSAYGAKDSIRDSLPESLTEPALEAVDRLLRELNREANRARG